VRALRPAGAAAGLALLALAGCGDPAPDAEDPAAAVHELFALARPGGAGREERLRALFGAEVVGEAGPALLDAVAALAPAVPARVAPPERLGADGPVAIDVEAELDGGGRARYSVQLARRPDGAWRIRWFQGPGVEWPAPSPRRDEGLSISPGP
jgi:hypothetical protein